MFIEYLENAARTILYFTMTIEYIQKCILQSIQQNKSAQKMFKEQGLDFIIQFNLKIVIVLDFIFNINDWTYKHKRKK